MLLEIHFSQDLNCIIKYKPDNGYIRCFIESKIYCEHGFISILAIMLFISAAPGAVVQDSSTKVFSLNFSVIFKTAVFKHSAVVFMN